MQLKSLVKIYGKSQKIDNKIKVLNKMSSNKSPRENMIESEQGDAPRPPKETRSTQLFCLENPNLSPINRHNLKRQRYVFTDNSTVSFAFILF